MSIYLLYLWWFSQVQYLNDNYLISWLALLSWIWNVSVAFMNSWFLLSCFMKPMSRLSLGKLLLRYLEWKHYLQQNKKIWLTWTSSLLVEPSPNLSLVDVLAECALCWSFVSFWSFLYDVLGRPKICRGFDYSLLDLRHHYVEKEEFRIQVERGSISEKIGNGLDWYWWGCFKLLFP